MKTKSEHIKHYSFHYYIDGSIALLVPLSHSITERPHNNIYLPRGPGFVSMSPHTSSSRTTTAFTNFLPITNEKMGPRLGKYKACWSGIVDVQNWTTPLIGSGMLHVTCQNQLVVCTSTVHWSI